MENKKLIDVNEPIKATELTINLLKQQNLPTEAHETFLRWLKNFPTVDAVEVVYCDNCVAHGSCVFEPVLHCLGYKKPFCCAGKMDGDEDD